MDIEKQLEVAAQSDHLVLIVFYADWSPHYEWIGPVLRTYERRVIELINVNIEEILYLLVTKQCYNKKVLQNCKQAI